MKKILLFLFVILAFCSCNENTPSNNQELSHNDSLVLELKTKLIGESYVIWQDYEPNTTIYSKNLKFKNDSVMILTIGWIGYSNNCIYYGEDELPVKSIEYKKYEIRFDETGWNAFIKIGDDVSSIKYNDNQLDNYKSITIGNTTYHKTSPHYPTIIKYVNEFLN